MGNSPATVLDFHILPVNVPQLPAYPHPAAHYLYIRPSNHSDSDTESSGTRLREIFISNVPVDSTKDSIITLFKRITNGVGRIADVIFEGEKHKHDSKYSKGEMNSGSKKRKRSATETLEAAMRTEDAQLPPASSRTLKSSGSSAVVIFVDQASAAAAMKAVRRKAKHREAVDWKTEKEEVILGSKCGHRLSLFANTG
jgi:ribosomal RNA-processing protein 7